MTIDFTKPFQFTRNCGDYDTDIYTCSPGEDGKLIVSWENGKVDYKKWEVEDCIDGGKWTILTNENTQQEDAMNKLEDYIKAINKNVPEQCPHDLCCDCIDDEYLNAELCTCQGEQVLLDAIKDFTKSTGASVWVNDGEYEIYYSGSDNPAKASTDVDMQYLMDAISLVHEATFGEGV